MRNVHVPYKFAPAIIKRSLSVCSSSSTTVNDEDSDCDYVTLTYSNEGLEAIDGDYIRKNSTPVSKLNEKISCSDTNICYNKRNSNTKLSTSTDENSLNDSIATLDRTESSISSSKSFLYRLISSKPHNEEDMGSQRSLSNSINKRRSIEAFNFNVKNHPPIYRQGSQDLGNRIAHVDYADPKTLFSSTVNVFVNKNSLSQRDSIVSSSTDSISEAQKQKQEPELFSDSFYEETAESLLENDFRDSAIYSDETSPSDEHIYATVTKPQIPKKPAVAPKTFLVKTPATSPRPPVPIKPSNLKSPEVRNAILNMRKVNRPTSRDKDSTTATCVTKTN